MKVSIFGFVFLFALGLFAQNAEPRDPLTGRTITVERSRDDAQYLLRQADQHWQQFDVEETLFALENAVNQNPQNVHALMRRARFHDMIGNQTEAAEDRRRANMVNPYALDLYDHDRSGHLSNIMAPANPQLDEEVGLQNRLNYYLDRFEDAYAEPDADHTRIEMITEAAEDLISGDAERAIALIDGLLIQHSEDALLHDLHGVALMEAGRYEDARVAFSQATELEPEFELAWINLGRADYLAGEYQAAVDHFNEGLRLDPLLAKGYFLRANAYGQLGNTTAALADYDRTVELRGRTYGAALLNRGLLKSRTGDFQSALDDVNLVIEQYPQRADLRLLRGNLYLINGWPIYALEDYNRALR